MSSSEDIQEKVAQSLAGTPFEITELVRLDGGIANFTYRGVLAQLTGNYSTVIIKHGEPYVASNTSFPLDTIRVFYENMMLGAVNKIDFNAARLPAASLPSIPAISVTTPEPYAYFKESSTIILQDFPLSTTLKAYFRQQTNKDSSWGHAIGVALGSALKTFHSWGAGKAAPQEAIRNKLRSNTMPNRVKYHINYGRLVKTIDRFPAIESSREIFGLVEQKMYFEMIEKGHEHIIHGDSWCGNILVTEPEASEQGNIASNPLQLAVIDWEFAHLGHPSWDIGQMLAELYLLVFFSNSSGAKECIAGFVEGYGVLDAEMQHRVAMQIGAHFLGITSGMSEWTQGMEEAAGRKAMEELVELGARFVRRGWIGINNPKAEEVLPIKDGVLHALLFTLSSSI